MLNPRRLLPALLLLAAVYPGAVYDRVFEAFNRVEHRLPGSPEFDACARVLEETLTASGLAVHRQRYRAIVPVTKECRFTVNGAQVSGLVPLAPNGVALPTTCGQTLEGPLLYLGDGGPDQTTNRSITGAFVLVDWGTPHASRLFSLGAKAVLFVGVDAPNPWNIEEYFSGYPLMLVRGYLSRADAERQGLLGGGPKSATLLIASAWQEVTGVNLWTLLPGAPGKQFALGREELIVLSSDISTVGTVPGLVPDTKAAANTALLAETTVALAGRKRERGVLTVFFGDHYAMFNGARQFYYAYYKALPHPENKDPFPVRAAMYRTDLEETKAKLRLLDAADYMAADSPWRRDVDALMRRRLDIKVNELNFTQRGLVLRGMKSPSKAQSNEEAAIKAEKSGWNGLREDLREKRVAPARAALFRALVAETRGELESYARTLQNNLQDTGDAMELARAITNRAITHHFEFAFDDAEKPWYFLRAWGHRFNRWQVQAIGNWSRSLSALTAVWNRVKDPSWPAPLLLDENASRVRPSDLAGRDASSASVAHAVNVYGYLLGSIGAAPGDQLPGR
ncbi:MAG: hypothetical protein J0L75_15935, partial [Spirochaetes bacterium]|nr:hypothetical protein [Spirochaetota bacterium]